MAYGVKVSVLFPPGEEKDFMIAEAHRLATRRKCLTEGREWTIDDRGDVVSLRTIGSCDEQIEPVVIEWAKETQ